MSYQSTTISPTALNTRAPTEESRLARGEWEWMEQAAREAGAGVVSRPDPGAWVLDVEALRRLPPALARLTVRNALGASSGRIIGQLFSEALVLASVGTIVGVMLSRVALRFALAQIAANDALPFWVDESLSWRTILYAAVLTLFGAGIVGILPALRVTRVNIQDMLRREAAGGAGLKFGGFWTAVIVV